MDAFTSGYDAGLNRWGTVSTAGIDPITPSENYKERVNYDANGNILTYLRNQTGANAIARRMDNMKYWYQYKKTDGSTGNFDPLAALPTDVKEVTNRLSYVYDVPSYFGYSTVDIDDQIPGNYTYDEIGNLVKDTSERIFNIKWTVYGKIAEINRSQRTPLGDSVATPRATSTDF
jgi:hypothetical protein